MEETIDKDLHDSTANLWVMRLLIIWYKNAGLPRDVVIGGQFELINLKSPLLAGVRRMTCRMQGQWRFDTAATWTRQTTRRDSNARS